MVMVVVRLSGFLLQNTILVGTVLSMWVDPKESLILGARLSDIWAVPSSCR